MRLLSLRGDLMWSNLCTCFKYFAPFCSLQQRIYTHTYPYVQIHIQKNCFYQSCRPLTLISSNRFICITDYLHCRCCCCRGVVCTIWFRFFFHWQLKHNLIKWIILYKYCVVLFGEWFLRFRWYVCVILSLLSAFKRSFTPHLNIVSLFVAVPTLDIINERIVSRHIKVLYSFFRSAFLSKIKEEQKMQIRHWETFRE